MGAREAVHRTGSSRTSRLLQWYGPGGCRPGANRAVRDRAMHAYVILFQQSVELFFVTVVTMIGGVRAEKVDRYVHRCQAARRFKEHVRRLRHHQGAEKAKPQAIGGGPLDTFEWRVVE